MAEQQIANLATRAAPLTRTTKDSEEFELLAVNATFNGAGAGGDFLPCVEIVSDAGLVVTRSVGQEAVTAGDSAEVTFAPFLGRTSGGGGGVQFDLQQAVYIAASQAVPAAGGNLTWAHSSGAALLDLTVPSAPFVNTAGLYAFNILTNYDDATVPGLFYSGNLTADSLAFVAQSHNVSPMSSNSSIGDTGETVELEMPQFGTVALGIFHEDAIAHNFSALMLAQKIT